MSLISPRYCMQPNHIRVRTQLTMHIKRIVPATSVVSCEHVCWKCRADDISEVRSATWAILKMIRLNFFWKAQTADILVQRKWRQWSYIIIKFISKVLKRSCKTFPPLVRRAFFFCCSEFFLLLTSRHTSIFFQFTPYCTSSLLSQTNRIKLFLLNSYRTGFNHKTKLGNRPSRRQRQAAQIKETAPVSNPRNQPRPWVRSAEFSRRPDVYFKLPIEEEA